MPILRAVDKLAHGDRLTFAQDATKGAATIQAMLSYDEAAGLKAAALVQRAWAKCAGAWPDQPALPPRAPSGLLTLVGAALPEPS